MALRSFLEALRESGRVRVAGPGALDAASIAGADGVLREMDRDARLDVAGEAPPLDLAAASWAAAAVHAGCRFLAFREVSAEVVRASLALACPSPPSPSSAWSVDLTFRWLPDLLVLARGVAEGDPLVEGLVGLGRAWPLSSVGARGLGDHLDPIPAQEAFAFVDHSALLQLYVDRIIERRDVSRLAHPRVREAARAALGLHASLAPEMAAALEERDRPA